MPSAHARAAWLAWHAPELPHLQALLQEPHCFLCLPYTIPSTTTISSDSEVARSRLQQLLCLGLELRRPLQLGQAAFAPLPLAQI